MCLVVVMRVREVVSVRRSADGYELRNGIIRVGKAKKQSVCPVSTVHGGTCMGFALSFAPSRPGKDGGKRLRILIRR